MERIWDTVALALGQVLQSIEAIELVLDKFIEVRGCVVPEEHAEGEDENKANN